ncbi:universal stress protein [Natrinema marinum]|uniref:universal stress protein n=1 Tax=Natrinema marinum TaxID=2961598 RepID=UPI0020C904B7|nr:universal stress protein [Natrinema marinum]
MTDRILVPYDGSPPSADALEYALETFPDARVTALYVVPTPDGYEALFENPEDRVPVVDAADDRGRDILDEARGLAADRGADLETEIVTGKPDHEIVDYAAAEDVDTVVLGSHGREGVSRLLLGSVAENVVRRSPIPVVVVR